MVPELFVISICALALALMAVGISVSVLGNYSIGTTDFVEYWASAHQLKNHANPYAADAILDIERSLGHPLGEPALVMWNPPSALLLILPLGFFSPRVGHLLWLLLLLASLVASVQLIWNMHGRPKGWLNLLGYTFAPALICLLAGQVSLFVLLGLVLFLRLNRSRPFLAGAALWFCMLKPHLLLPVGVVLLVWSVITRSYKVLAGTAFALILSSLVVLVFDPLVWTHYLQMAHAAQMEVTIPCLSIMFRRVVSPHSHWVQYVPAALGCLWAVKYFRMHRSDWNWLEHGSLLTLVSVLVAPYSWIMDQAILIPALLHAAYRTRSRSLLAVLALASAIVDVGALRSQTLLHSVYFAWTAPAWLIWYLFATRQEYLVNGPASVVSLDAASVTASVID